MRKERAIEKQWRDGLNAKQEQLDRGQSPEYIKLNKR